KRFEKLGKRLRIIIDDDGAHGLKTSSESQAAERLAISAGAANVKRQHLGKLQHNKTIVVKGKKTNACVCGSTNHSWRGFFVQNNNAIVLRGETPAKIFMQAFDDYFANDGVAGFGATGSAVWNDLKLKGIDAKIGFSPRTGKNVVLKSIAQDIGTAKSSLFYSLAFLFQTKGDIQNSIKKLKKQDKVFSYGISDHDVKEITGNDATGIDVQKPDGNVTLVRPEALA